MATATTLPSEENPSKTLLDLSFQQPHQNANETLLLASSESDAPLSDIEMKIRRAERFHISPHLSEQDKRNSRAQRFGTGIASTLLSSDVAKLEQQKRKARAERFGMPIPSTAADEDAKKKARALRFANPS